MQTYKEMCKNKKLGKGCYQALQF